MKKFLLSASSVLRAVAGLLLLSALSGTAGAVQVNALGVPEVDPGSIASALALLAGGGLLAADRFRRMARAMKAG